MRLSEITSNVQQDLPLYICVFAGTLHPHDIKNCWVFDTYEDADRASHSNKATNLLDLGAAAYLPAFKTANGVGVMLELGYAAYKHLHTLPEHFKILAVGPSEKSARLAAKKTLTKQDIQRELWCYKTWNSDPSYFDEDEE